jgi:hypothetical protein
MKHFQLNSPATFECCGLRPEEKWLFALYRSIVWPPAVNDLVRNDGMHRFTVDCLGMHMGWKANRDCEEDNSKRS